MKRTILMIAASLAIVVGAHAQTTQDAGIVEVDGYFLSRDQVAQF